MRLHLFPAFILACVLIVPALGQDVIDSSSGPVEVEPDTEENIVSVPLDEETGTVDWQNYTSLPSGGGANFGFVASLYPPDPAALADSPRILLDSAWYPPIPFAFGYTPPTGGQVTTRGWWYLEDASGNLARRDMDITADSDTWFCSTWFIGGGWLFHIEQEWASGYSAEDYYLADEWTGPGIDYFIRSVWFRGVLGGERMNELLELCGAERIGRDIINGGRDRLAIFQVPANEVDRQNGRGRLLVWVTVGDWRIVRTRLHAAYAIEVTEFQNVSIEVSNDPQVYYSEYLPPNTYWSIDQYLLTHESTFPGVDPGMADVPREPLVYDGSQSEEEEPDSTESETDDADEESEPADE